MIEKIQQFIDERKLFTDSDKLLLAVSGGADSMALMNIIASLGYNCAVAHINHNLRPGACDKDEHFVIEQAKSLDLEVVTKSVEVISYANENKLSIETAARTLRINSLIEFANQLNCNTIVTAHHGDDSVETIVHRLLRGTAYRGLAGIWPVNEIEKFKFTRPMLCVTRAEIENFLEDNALSFRHDHTNDEIDYTRNWIRHELLPYLEKKSTATLRKKLLKLSFAAQRLDDKIQSLSQSAFDKIARCQMNMIEFDLMRLNTWPAIVKAQLFRQAFDELNLGQQGINNTHYLELIKMAVDQNGSVNLPQDFRAYVKGDKIIITPIAPDLPESTELNIPGQTEFMDMVIEAEIHDACDCDFDNFLKNKDLFSEWFDYDKISTPLCVRLPRTGDKFQPLGKSSQRKIGDFTSSQADILVADTSKIIWIIGARPSELTKISPETTRILQLRIRYKKTPKFTAQKR